MICKVTQGLPANISIKPVADFIYEDGQWITEVGALVAAEAKRLNAQKIGVIGYDKDHSSYYLNYFPHWSFIEAPQFPPRGETVDATKIRNLMFADDLSFISSVVPDVVYGEIVNFTERPEFCQLKEDWDYINEYKRAWAAAPYAPTFVTTDAIVVQSGHVLLVQRGMAPGRGLWAMPGGFLDGTERLEDGVIRELREETRLKVPEKVLKGSIVSREVFDEPDRSSRGRTVTHAFLFKLDDAAKLPLVKGGDDAAVARWFPLSTFCEMQDLMFEDHWHIINRMITKL
jgi:bifunctional NMN adenylyltransferase/nudix hydrolase